jgi:hypothetical protein
MFSKKFISFTDIWKSLRISQSLSNLLSKDFHKKSFEVDFDRFRQSTNYTPLTFITAKKASSQRKWQSIEIKKK